MEKSFWIQRWENNEIGFHRNETNHFLEKYGKELIHKNTNVLVPLCGKSLDLLWLANHAQQVTGVEVSGTAIESFFKENGLVFIKDKYFYTAKNIKLLEKDLFDLSIEDTGTPDLVYDRASIVALPQEMRKKYAEKIISLQPEKILVVILEYKQNEMNGPPFSVMEKEINSLYQNDYKVNLLDSVDSLILEPRFRERGISSMFEKCLLLEKK